MATRIYKTPFAATGDKEALATADQPDGKVSLQAGWTPDYELANDSPNYRPVGRAEMNGILNEITAALGELQMSGFAPWQAITGGWAKDAYVVHEGVAYRSLIDSNEDTPGVSEASWVPAFNYGIGVVSGLTNANVTLNAGQYSKPIVTLSGTLTGNVQVIFPKTLQRWLVVNNTTGAFTVTCKTATGTGVAIPSGGSQEVWGDGANLYAYVPAQVQALLPFRGQQAFTTPGTTNWTVPAGVYAVFAEAWGGGGGSASRQGTNNCFAGGGGGGGEYRSGLFSVTPGQVLAIQVGAGGTAGGAYPASGGAGGSSGISGLVTASGGAGGTVGTTSSSGIGGDGGTRGTGGSFAISGQKGGIGDWLSSTAGVGGEGGMAPRGGSGAQASTGGSGTGIVPGGGAGSTGFTGSAATTYPGAPGGVVISW